MKALFVAAVAALVIATAGVGHAKDGFKRFREEPINAKGSYKLIPDPTGEAGTSKVDRFTILPGKCNSSSKYSNGNSDCTFKSVRSQLYQPPPQTQPKEAWYGWSMYLPPDFPFGNKQTAGLYSFAYWHNGDCPHLAVVSDTGRSTKLRLQTNIVPKDGSFDCYPDMKIEFADLADLLGKWHRFEAHVRWSTGADGFAELFLDGTSVAAFKGRTLSLHKPKRNYFKYGLYLCCTKGTEGVTPATALYAKITRARTREGLK